jgi:hypothetical protein
MNTYRIIKFGTRFKVEQLDGESWAAIPFTPFDKVADAREWVEAHAHDGEVEIVWTKGEWQPLLTQHEMAAIREHSSGGVQLSDEEAACIEAKVWADPSPSARDVVA